MGTRVETFDETSPCSGLEIERLSSGEFHWTIGAFRLGPMQLFRGRLSSDALLTGTTPRGFVTIILPTSADSRMQYWSEVLDPTRFGSAPPGSPFHIVFPVASEFLLCQMPASGTEWLPTDPIRKVIGQSSRHLAIESGRGACFISALNDIVDRYRMQTDLLAVETGSSPAVSEVSRRFTELLAHARPTFISRSRAVHQQVLNRALDISRRQFGPMSLPDFATAAGASPRTLQRIFREILDLSPQRYLRQKRLHGLRCELLAASRHTSTVTEIAAHWGFVQMGRLAREYRQLFGELPRATLMLDPNPAYGRDDRVA